MPRERIEPTEADWRVITQRIKDPESPGNPVVYTETLRQIFEAGLERRCEEEGADPEVVRRLFAIELLHEILELPEDLYV